MASPKPKKVAKKTSKASSKKAAKPPKKAAAKKAAKGPAFGRHGTAGKAEGDAAVRAWIAGVKPGQREMVKRLDALLGDAIPGVQRAIKWSTPLYGVPGKGWVASIASFKEHVNLSFFSGVHLNPPPPLGESKLMRRVDLRSMDDFDEKLFRSWAKQASQIQGWGRV